MDSNVKLFKKIPGESDLNENNEDFKTEEYYREFISFMKNYPEFICQLQRRSPHADIVKAKQSLSAKIFSKDVTIRKQ